MTYEGNERNLANKIVFVDEIDKKEVVVASKGLTEGASNGCQ